METAVEVLPGGTDPDDVARLHAALAARLGGADLPPLLPVEPGADPGAVRAELEASLVRPVPSGTAVLLRTSGSTTGRGHVVALGAAALTASARATHARLGGPGRWILAVPAHHVAGLQILTRSHLSGHEPVVLDTSGGFDPAMLAGLVRATADLGDRTYLSLVPTQLVRALGAGDEVRSALARLDAVLVGGAALAPAVHDDAAGAGITVVRTYGMTETGGGCVYDGVPLDGVEIDVDAETRVWIAGPHLASGYLDDEAADAETFAGGRLRTTDSGALDAGGRLEILGRLDDAITTGGVTVAPLAVERRLSGLSGLAECAVVGVPDPEWGELVVAVVVRRAEGADPAGAADLPELLAVARARARDLSPAHAPRALVVVDGLPLRGPGKIDRRAVTAIAARALGAGPGRDAGSGSDSNSGAGSSSGPGPGSGSGERESPGAPAADATRVRVTGVARHRSRPALG